jgi:uncharacterized membrane protein
VSITQLVGTLLYAGVGVQTPYTLLIHLKSGILATRPIDQKKEEIIGRDSKHLIRV